MNEASADQHKQQRIDALIDDVIARRCGGAVICDDAITQQHAELMPELKTALDRLSQIESAVRSCHSIRTTPESQSIRKPDVSGYELLRQVNRGYQAEIFLARHLATTRVVAMKVMHDSSDDAVQAVERFDREARILATLHHPNIVSILDRGTTSDGRVYFTMDYIDGLQLDAYLRDAEVSPATSGSSVASLVRMFIDICRAVNVAHIKGIVHRDLKPANIRVDERGHPHVLDFGLAHSPMEVSAFEDLSLSTDIFVGSVPWASPEQASGDTGKVDTRTDVYALGVMLYQALTGEFPYGIVGPVRDVFNNIMCTPPTAFDVLKSNERQPRDQAREMFAIDSRLEQIVLKALAKQRDDRYQTAGELARALDEFMEATRDDAAGNLSGSPAPDSRFGPTGLLIMTLLTLGAGVCGWLVVNGRHESSAQNVPTVAGVSDRGHVPRSAARLVPYEAISAPLSPTALVREPTLIKGLASWTLETHKHRGDVKVLAISPDGATLATGGEDGAVRLWRVETGELTQILTGHPGQIDRVVWSSNGQHIAASGRDSDAIVVWQVDTAMPTCIIDTGLFSEARQFTSDGQSLLISQPSGLSLVNASTGERTTLTQELISDAVLLTESGGYIGLNRDGRVAVAQAGAAKEALLLQNVTAAASTLAVHTAPAGRQSGSDAGAHRLAIAAETGTLEVWNLKTQRRLWSRESNASILSLQWSPAGQAIAIVRDAAPAEVQVIDAASGDVIRTLPDAHSLFGWGRHGSLIHAEHGTGVVHTVDGEGHRTPLAIVALPRPAPVTMSLSWDGRELAVFGGAGRRIATIDASERSWLQVPDLTTSVAMSPDRGAMAVTGRQGTVVVDRAKPQRLSLSQSGITAINGPGAFWSPDGRHLAAFTDHDTVAVFDATSYELRIHEDGVLRASNASPAVVWSPDSRRLAVRLTDGRLALVDVHAATDSDAPKRLVLAPADEGYLVAPAWSTHGTMLAAWDSSTRCVTWWRAHTGEQVGRTVNVVPNSVDDLAWGPEGDLLAVAQHGGGGNAAGLNIIDVSTGQQTLNLDVDDDRPIELHWVDASHLQAMCADGGVRQWDVVTGMLESGIEGRLPHVRHVRASAWNRSADVAAAIAMSGTVHVWRASTGQPLFTYTSLARTGDLVVDATGRFGGDVSAVDELRIIAERDDGRRQLLTLDAFSTKYGWVNAPMNLSLAE